MGGRDAFALASVLFGPPRMRVWIRREPIGLPTTLEARMGDTGERVFFEVEYEVDPEGARRF